MQIHTIAREIRQVETEADSSNCLVSLNGEARLLVSRDRVKELGTDLKELTAE